MIITYGAVCRTLMNLQAQTLVHSTDNYFHTIWRSQ